jgi:hypothetical protein
MRNKNQQEGDNQRRFWLERIEYRELVYRVHLEPEKDDSGRRNQSCAQDDRRAPAD